MLIVLSLLLAAVAVRIMKQNTSGSTMLVGIIGVAALMSAGGGIKLLSDATAADPPNIELSNPEGATVGIIVGELNHYENTSGVAQQIIKIDIPQGCGDFVGYGGGHHLAATSTSELETETSALVIEGPRATHCEEGDIQLSGSICFINCEELDM